MHNKQQNIPPVFDNELSIKQSKAFGEKPLAFLQEGVKRYGNMFYAMIGVKRTLVISHPHIIKQVLQDETRFGLSGADRIFKAMLGESQGTSHGDTWRTHNKLSRPYFTMKVIEQNLQQTYDVLSAELADLANKLDVEMDMTTKAKESILNCTLQFLGHTATQKEIKQIILLYDDFLENILSKVRNPFSKEIRDNSIDHLNETVPSFNETIQSIIDMRSHPIVARYQESADASSKNLRDQLAGIIVTGYGAVSYAVDSTLVFISQHPEVEQKVISEVEEHFHNPCDIFRLKYLEAVLSESMRLMPPAWMVSRRVNEDVQLEGYDIPKGTEILVNIYGMNRNFSVWDLPNQFKPERFLDKKPEELRNIFMPFGSGRRVCLGTNFAMQEMLMYLAICYKNYRFKTPDKVLEAMPKLSVTFAPHKMIVQQQSPIQQTKKTVPC